MLRSLNPYNRYFDPSLDERIKLVNKALKDFSSDQKWKIKLNPCLVDLFVKELENLSRRLGFKWMLDNVPTLRRMIPADPDVEDSVETFEYYEHIKMFRG